VENNVSKAGILMVFKTFWNCREHFENNVFKACTLKVSETIWNCRKIIEIIVSKEVLRYLKRFGTVGTI